MVVSAFNPRDRCQSINQHIQFSNVALNDVCMSSQQRSWQRWSTTSCWDHLETVRGSNFSAAGWNVLHAERNLITLCIIWNRKLRWVPLCWSAAVLRARWRFTFTAGGGNSSGASIYSDSHHPRLISLTPLSHLCYLCHNLGKAQLHAHLHGEEHKGFLGTLHRHWCQRKPGFCVYINICTHKWYKKRHYGGVMPQHAFPLFHLAFYFTDEGSKKQNVFRTHENMEAFHFNHANCPQSSASWLTCCETKISCSRVILIGLCRKPLSLKWKLL